MNKQKSREDIINTEVELVIKSWYKELGLKKTWVKNLHPADILNKHIFPALTQREAEVREEQVSSSDGGSSYSSPSTSVNLHKKPSDRIKEVAVNRASELSRVSCYDAGLAICQIEEICKILDEFDEDIL